MSHNVDLRLQLTVGQDLDKLLTIGQTSCDKLLDTDLGVALGLNKLLKRGEVDSKVLLVIDVLEAGLRQTALQRHLTAFEADLLLITRASLGTLVTTGGCATKSRAGTTANPAT